MMWQFKYFTLFNAFFIIHVSVFCVHNVRSINVFYIRMPRTSHIGVYIYLTTEFYNRKVKRCPWTVYTCIYITSKEIYEKNR